MRVKLPFRLGFVDIEGPRVSYREHHGLDRFVWFERGGEFFFDYKNFYEGYEQQPSYKNSSINYYCFGPYSTAEIARENCAIWLKDQHRKPYKFKWEQVPPNESPARQLPHEYSAEKDTDS